MADSTPSIGSIISSIISNGKSMVTDVVDLAKAELAPMGKAAGIGVGLLVVAAYFLFNGLALLFIAAGFGVGALFGGISGFVALGFLIVAIVVFLLAGLLVYIAVKQFKKVHAPTEAINAAKENVNTITQSIARANADIKTDELERKTFTHPVKTSASDSTDQTS